MSEWSAEIDSVVETLNRKNVVDNLRDYLEGEGQVWVENRDEKDRFLSEHLFDPEKVEDLDEGTIRQMVKRIWAFGTWTNPDYPVEQMLESGLPTIRSAFEHLLFSEAPLADRFDKIIDSVRMMGAAGVSEILCHYDPSRYAIWNRPARQGLIALGISEGTLPASKQISGSQYERYCELTREIVERARTHESFIDNLFYLDYVLFYLSTVELEDVQAQREEEAEKEKAKDFDHDDAITDILELGDGLGFEVEDEVGVAPGAQVDAIWRTRIANLGTISYAFEVQRRGSRDSAILNLQKVLNQDASIRKVVLVSTEHQLADFRSEIETLPERFRDSVGYLDVSQLLTALDHLDGLKEVLSGPGLLERAV